MAGLKIGPGLSLPPEAVTETFGILAKRGVGKTYTAAVMVEEFVKAGLPVVIPDPIGVWWGLRSSADGKSPGLPVTIIGGEHGDIPLESTAGAVVADMLVDDPTPLVIDLSLFRKAEARRFMTDFLETLYRKNRNPLHVVLDEADEWAPQRPQKGAERLLGACEDLVRRGRARGIGCTLITQRPAVINKDVLTQIEVLVALRTISPQDLAAVREWIKVHGTKEQAEELMDSLPSLPIGTSWWWSPGWLDIFQRVEVRRRETFDSSSTPKAGKRVAAPREYADVDLAALKERMTETIERAKADDPKELHRKIRDLAALLAKAEKKKGEVIEKIVREPYVPTELVDAVTKIQYAVEEFAKALPSIASPATPPPPKETAPKVAPRPEPSKSTSTDDVTLKAGARRILDTMARHYPLRMTKTQWATLSRFRASGGTFQSYWSVLKRAGLIDEDSAGWFITDAGHSRADSVPKSAATTDELLEQWYSVLKKGAREMLAILVKEYPTGMTRAQLADAVEMVPSGGTFQSYLSTLRRNALIDTSGELISASPALFLGGTQ